MMHFPRSIYLFGSPNGLCSSITESKHIKAVKEPWRRSNRFDALPQMLQTISRLEKMAAIQRKFSQQGMMAGSTASYTEMVLAGGAPQPQALIPAAEDEDDDDLGPLEGPKVLSSVKLAKTQERQYSRFLDELALEFGQPRFPEAFRRFLWDQMNPNAEIPSSLVPLTDCPGFSGKIHVYHSAVARFYAPSDLCGARGMYRERIRSHPNWRGKYPRHDTVFIETDADLPGMQGMVIGRVLLFFSFKFHDEEFSCALVNWLVPVGDRPDDETGLWVVKPEFVGNQRSVAVVHVDSIVRGAHLLPIYGTAGLPEDFHFSQALDVFRAYFINSYVDHHTHEFLATP
ncbi:hypothetical protein H0H81_010387 [Sphagnurus paluster]|uniref:Uncharacterized protein n=1 Tax=Sphagnurus paluster TaxID=117069 RepID=A0A9P7GPB0_9AGAR|nr:hypothetical protein H0H81_010387 [Sphagnurus paluster]